MKSVWVRQSLRLLAGCSLLEMGATHPSQAFTVMKHLDQKDLRAPRSTDEKLETSRGCVWLFVLKKSQSFLIQLVKITLHLHL